MFSYLLPSFLAAIQHVNEKSAGSKYLFAAVGIAALLVLVKSMEQKVTASKKRITHAQRKEMRKLKWKLIMGMFKRKSKDKGSAGITILAILALVLIVGGLIALTGWKIALFFLVGVPLLYLLLRNKK